MSATECIEKIGELIPPRAMLTAPDLMAGYLVDWTGNFHGDALAVVRPSSTEEVSLIMGLCTDHQVSLTVQGGNTGLVGGSVPRFSGPQADAVNQNISSMGSDSDAILLSTTYLCSFEDFDPISGHVTVGAGVTLVQLDEFARTHGLEFGVDLAARDSATVGGMTATNAGGIHVVARGMMRKQVVGVEAVLPSGEVISTLRGLAKDNTGYDFTQLLCGSEGTLAVITKVRVQLRRPEAVQLLVFGVDSISAALKIASGFIGNIHAAEIVDRASIDCVKRVTRTAVPFDSAFHLLLEVRGELDSDPLATCDNLVVAVDATDREKLWSLRERVTESLAVESAGVVHKLDVSVPQVVLSETYSALCGLLEPPGVGQVAIFGHLLDGNFHIFFTTKSENHDIDREVLELISSLGGSISAEHGIGRMKAEYLHLSRSEAEIAVMRAVKGAIDPLGIMNPGVLFI
ncbi:FAD-binding oxidoreductase [Actinomycetota bacterium]|nr:FAD-binding oxidoreductase [Actinomycetota bacterium]